MAATAVIDAMATASSGRNPELTAVGQLFADDATCSAAVVASSSGRLAMTAAHCVYVPPATDRMPDVHLGRTPGWAEQLLFIPARAGDESPHGVWEIERIWVDQTWRTAPAPEVDVAFLELRDSPSGTAQDLLGSLGLRFDHPQQALGPAVDVLGYPAVAPYDGLQLRRCGGAATDTAHPDLLEARCEMTQGASGGPWVLPQDGWWSAVAVTSYLSLERPGTMGGARLGAVAERLWRSADREAQL